MSFGGKEDTTQSQGKSYYDPTQTGIVDNYAQGVQQAGQPGGALAYQPYTGPGLSFGNPTALNGLMNYAAPTATSTGYTANTVDPSSVGNVTAGQLATTNLQPYENPYTSNVIDTTSAQLARQNNIDNTTAAGQATAAGAFGGSRSAVLQNLNTDSYQRNLDQTVAGLNQSNFTQAQGAATTDIGNTLQANEANQAKNLSAAQGNQSATNQGLAFGATAQNTASLANQQADLAAAQTKLSALGLNATQAQAIFGANWQQFLNSQTDPQAVQAAITQAMGLVPASPLQQTSSFGQGASFNYGVPIPGSGG